MTFGLKSEAEDWRRVRLKLVCQFRNPQSERFGVRDDRGRLRWARERTVVVGVEEEATVEATVETTVEAAVTTTTTTTTTAETTFAAAWTARC